MGRLMKYIFEDQEETNLMLQTGAKLVGIGALLNWSPWNSHVGGDVIAEPDLDLLQRAKLRPY